tara:strand:+ start:487 stop:1158 length:672 start_codon:yes stop_codon:yes gene_type:complete
VDQDALKRAVARAAADYIDPMLAPSTVVGVGTGSTANHFIDCLAEVKHKFDGAVSSSVVSEERMRGHGIPVYDLNSVDEIPVYVDGADETNHRLHLIKGGGGALTREKIVASVAHEFVCIADESKLVDTLGAYPLPVEVIPMARGAVARTLVGLGGDPVWRDDFTTDNGNIILDVHGLSITDPVGLETAINNVTGVVTCGLFAARPADVLLLSTPDGVDTLRA